MKKLFAALLALCTSVAFATTTVPVQLLNPTGSSSGQAIVSTGASSAPVWGGVGLNGIAAIAANTVLANATASSAAPTAFAMPSCSATGNALNWTTSTGFTCQTGLAPLASPALTGTPTAPTAAAGTNTTQIATTAFVQGINSGRLLNVQVFTSTSTYTATAGTNSVIVEVQAAGGGGGGVSATGANQAAIAQAGSAGAYASARITSGFSGVMVTIGAAGTGGPAGTNAGTTASTSSFGSLVSCPGGIGGAGSAAQTPPFEQSGAASPAAPTISGATTLFSSAGQKGTLGVAIGTAALPSTGGVTGMGYGSTTGNGSGGDGAAIGASTGATAGQNGAAAKVIVYEYD